MATAPRDERNLDAARRRVIEAVRAFPFAESPVAQQLQSLAPKYEIEGIEIEPEGVIISGDSFRGAMNLYVLLAFPDGLESAEAFLGHFEGTFQGDEPAITRVELKLGSFFA